MADSTTTHYGFTLPEVGGSADTWGTKLNQNWTDLDADLNGLNGAKLAKSSNLSDLADKPTARTNLGLGGAAVLAVGTTAGTVAAGDDSRIAGAAQKSANLSDLGSAATARSNLGLDNSPAGRTNLGLGALATLGTVNNSVWSGTALSVANGGTGATDASSARTNLGLGALATLGGVNNSYWSGTALSVANGGTGAADAATARTNLGLGSVENKSSAAIRGELTKGNVEAALGKTAVRVTSGAAANSGLISWGTAAPGSLAEGEIYLRYS